MSEHLDRLERILAPKDPYPPAAITQHWPFLYGLSGYNGPYKPREPYEVEAEAAAIRRREAAAIHARRTDDRPVDLERAARRALADDLADVLGLKGR